MNTPPATHLLPWLVRCTGFPASRLESRAECLLLIAAAAHTEETAGTPVNGGVVPRRDQAKDAANRAHALRRSSVHYRCDNSAKV